MARHVWKPLSLTALLCSASTLAQEEQKRQPPPEFSSGYFPPTPTTPNPRQDIFAVVDVAVLAVVLVLTVWFVYRMRSRTMVRLLVVFSLLYFGFYRLGCVCAVGSIQNVALALGDSGYVLPVTVAAFFLLPLATALFYGRVFCAAACPLGALQDIVLLRPIQTPRTLDHVLGVVPYLYLGVAIAFAWTGAGFVLCRYDPFIPFYRMGGHWGVMAFGAGLLLVGTRVGRPYCRFLCPYGVLLRWASALSARQVRITPGECLHCHLCADECPFGAIYPPTKFEPPWDRAAARRRMGYALILLIVLSVGLGALGYASAPALARSHRDVQLADRLWLEEQGRVSGTTEQTDAYRQLARPYSAAYAQAAKVLRRFRIAATLLGVWFGVVIGGKLIALSRRRYREDYEADRAACLTCARCYMSCPVEHERLGLITLE